MSTSPAALLETLGLRPLNPGACTGPDAWISEPEGHKLTSFNPTTGEPIATVMLTSPAAYERVAAAATDAFRTWREVPAPKRGEVVRDLGEALRAKKEPLGDLVTLEMGKIRAEGHGEVQEMIDICDFAVGLSRQLYGLTMPPSGRAIGCMEQWHPLGPVGVITRLQLPRGGLVVERRYRGRLRRYGHLETGANRRRSRPSPSSTSPTPSWPITG